jgi:hypothetical protein
MTVSNEWIRNFIRKELATIVIALDRRSIDEVTDKLVDVLEQQHLTMVPTYLCDEMYDVQKQISAELTYRDANLLYTSALASYSNRESASEKENEHAVGFW